MYEDRPSVTATVVAALRALYTNMPEPYRLASDPLAVELVPAPLALPARAMALAPWAAPAVHRGLGVATLGLNYHVTLRTRAIDDALRGAITAGAEQLVLLGAGLDNRALRLPELAGLDVFEVDHPSTQRYKVDRLASLPRAPVPLARRLRRVAVDFERQRLPEVLLPAGYLPARRTFWIWEGVTIYLTPEAIAATLRAVAGLSSPGSRIGLTYGTMAGDAFPAWLIPVASRAFGLLGEPLKSPLRQDELLALLRSAGFDVLSDEGTADWAARYWPWQRGVRAIERLAVGLRT